MSDDPRVCRTAGLPPDYWFRNPGSPESEHAKRLCAGCPLVRACRRAARIEGIPYGVFGGEDADERGAWWAANGGKPSIFLDAIDSLIGTRVKRTKIEVA